MLTTAVAVAPLESVARTVSAYDDVTSWSRDPRTTISPSLWVILNFPPVLPAMIEYVTMPPSGSSAETWPTTWNEDAFSATVKLYVDDAKTGGDGAVGVGVGVATGVAGQSPVVPDTLVDGEPKVVEYGEPSPRALTLKCTVVAHESPLSVWLVPLMPSSTLLQPEEPSALRSSL